MNTSEEIESIEYEIMTLKLKLDSLQARLNELRVAELIDEDDLQLHKAVYFMDRM